MPAQVIPYSSYGPEQPDYAGQIAQALQNIYIRKRQMELDAINAQKAKSEIAYQGAQVGDIAQQTAQRKFANEEAARAKAVEDAALKMTTVPGVVAGAGAEPLVKLPLPQPTLAGAIAQPGQSTPQVPGPAPETPSPATAMGQTGDLTPGQEYVAKKQLGQMNQAEAVTAQSKKDIALGQAMPVTAEILKRFPQLTGMKVIPTTSQVAAHII